MTPLSQNHKTLTKGGISELAIFAIITLVSTVITVATNVVASSLNAKANQERQNNHGLFSLKASPDIYVY